MMSEERKFPLIRSERTIPWSVAEKVYEEYARRYGTEQSLERLAERGGFGENELDMFYPEWRQDA